MDVMHQRVRGRRGGRRRSTALVRVVHVVASLVALTALAGVNVAVATPVAAQNAPPATTVPGRPGPTTTTTAPPQQSSPPPSEGDEDSAPTEVPQDQVEVPPGDPNAPPDPSAPILQQIAGLSLAEASKGLKEAAAAQAMAATQAGTLTTQVTELEARLAALEAEKAQAVARLQQARLQLKKRAVAGYMGSPAAPINQILDATDFNDLSRRFELLQSVVESDRARIDEYNNARIAAGNELDGVVAVLDAKRSALTIAATRAARCITTRTCPRSRREWPTTRW